MCAARVECVAITPYLIGGLVRVCVSDHVHFKSLMFGGCWSQTMACTFILGVCFTARVQVRVR
jgi:hypothetical protein